MDVELPAFVGFIGTTLDAFIAVQAVRQHLAPRLTGRLSEKARKHIASGHIYVYNTEESGINRWTDGRKWQPSRILDNFLIYRERNANSGKSSPEEETDDPVGGFRDTGLIKKTITLCEFHVVAYYRPADIANKTLHTPSSTPQYASLRISSDLLTESHLRYPPVVEHDAEGVIYKGESPEITGTSLRLHTMKPRSRENRLPQAANGTASSSKSKPPRISTTSPPPLSATSSSFTQSSASATTTPEIHSTGGILLPEPIPSSFESSDTAVSAGSPAINFPVRIGLPSRLVRQAEKNRHSPYPTPCRSPSNELRSPIGTTDTLYRSDYIGSSSASKSPPNTLRPLTKASLVLPPLSYTSSISKQQDIINSALNPQQRKPGPFLPPLQSCSFPHLSHYAFKASSPEPYAPLPPLASFRKPNAKFRGWDRQDSPVAQDDMRAFRGLVAAASASEERSVTPERYGD